MLEKLWAGAIAPASGDGCVEWGHSRSPEGYGRLGGSYTHRLIYAELVGEIPDGFVIDHLCRNRICMNPNHLEAVTQAENLRRGEGISARNALKTHCPKGHEYDEENTYLRPDRPGRGCKQCRNRKAVVG